MLLRVESTRNRTQNLIGHESIEPTTRPTPSPIFLFLWHLAKLSSTATKERERSRPIFFYWCKLHYKKLANCWIGRSDFIRRGFRIGSGFGVFRDRRRTGKKMRQIDDIWSNDVSRIVRCQRQTKQLIGAEKCYLLSILRWKLSLWVLNLKMMISRFLLSNLYLLSLLRLRPRSYESFFVIDFPATSRDAPYRVLQ